MGIQNVVVVSVVHGDMNLEVGTLHVNTDIVACAVVVVHVAG